MEETKKLSLFKRLKIALFDLEKYIQFAVEKFRKALGYAVKLSIIFSIILILSSIFYIFIKYKSLENYLTDVIPDFSYVDGKIEFTDDEINEELKDYANGFVNQLSNYPEINLSNDLNKTTIINYIVSMPNSVKIIVVLIIVFMNSVDLLMYWLMTAFVSSVLGYLLLRMSSIKMKYSSIYSMAIYTSTLSMIIMVIYALLRQFFGVYIEIFDYIYIIISYIYMTAVILIIRNDLIKQHMELIHISQIQKEIKDKIEEKEETKEDKEKDTDDKDEDEDNKETGNKDEKPEIPDEPDGSEV